MTVLLSHFLTVIPEFGKGIIYSEYGTFINILWNGHSAVIMFFILSGFVLSLPLLKESDFSYSKYIFKRVCRIYLPYITIILITIVCKELLQSKVGTVEGLVNWAQWNIETNVNTILEHIFFLGEYEATTFSMVTWSLVHEMRISIVFPFIVFILMKFTWKASGVFAICLSVISFFLIQGIPTKFDTAISTNYFITLHYLGMFIVGTLIVKHKGYLINKHFNPSFYLVLVPVAVLFFNYPNIPLMVPYKLFGEIDFLLYKMMADWVITIGASMIILLALQSIKFSKFLNFKPIRFMGKVSYSLYLIHPVILISMVHIFYEVLSVPLILLISFLLTLILSWLSYEFIEKPSIEIGRYFTSFRKEKRKSKGLSI